MPNAVQVKPLAGSKQKTGREKFLTAGSFSSMNCYLQNLARNQFATAHEELGSRIRLHSTPVRIRRRIPFRIRLRMEIPQVQSQGWRMATHRRNTTGTHRLDTRARPRFGTELRIRRSCYIVARNRSSGLNGNLDRDIRRNQNDSSRGQRERSVKPLPTKGTQQQG